MYVLRHESDADADWGCEQFAGIVATVLTGARQRPDMPPSLLGSALMYAGFVAVRDSDATELDGALRLARHLEAQLRMGGKELIGVADLPDDRRHGCGHRRRSGLAEQGTDLPDERSRYRVTVHDHATALDLELTVDKHDDRRRHLSLEVHRLPHCQCPLR